MKMGKMEPQNIQGQLPLDRQLYWEGLKRQAMGLNGDQTRLLLVQTYRDYLITMAEQNKTLRDSLGIERL